MDMGLIGGLAAAYVLHEGCTPTCELNQQTLILLCVIVLVAALGARYMIKHSDGAASDQKIQPSSGKKSSEKRVV
jgi:hypothetical protein